jgi:hypothetical protein
MGQQLKNRLTAGHEQTNKNNILMSSIEQLSVGIVGQELTRGRFRAKKEKNNNNIFFLKKKEK